MKDPPLPSALLLFFFQYICDDLFPGNGRGVSHLFLDSLWDQKKKKKQIQVIGNLLNIDPNNRPGQ